MNKDLRENLEKDIKSLTDESLGILDLDKLREDLVEAINVLKNLDEKEKFCQRVISDCKNEIRKMNRVLANLKNQKTKIELVETLLENGDLGYEDLVKLKEVVKKEFDDSFSVSKGKRSEVFIDKERVKDWGDFKV